MEIKRSFFTRVPAYLLLRLNTQIRLDINLMLSFYVSFGISVDTRSSVTYPITQYQSNRNGKLVLKSCGLCLLFVRSVSVPTPVRHLANWCQLPRHQRRQNEPLSDGRSAPMNH